MPLQQFNSYLLSSNEEKRKEYSERLKTRIQEMDEEQMTWETIADGITEAAAEVVGFRISSKNNRPENPEVR